MTTTSGEEKKSIPDWSYDVDFYDALTSNLGFEIRTDPVKGKGLYATRDFAKDDIVLTEIALCCTQNIDDYQRSVPCCAYCLYSLESPQRIVARCTGNKAFGNGLPAVEGFRTGRDKIYCRNRSKGCREMYCNERCADAAWKNHHYTMCAGALSEERRDLFNDFLGKSWEQGGVDYSDTHFFALRFIAGALTRRRMQKLPIGHCYAPIAQLIRTPIHKFNFTFLLGNADETTKEKYDSFMKYKTNPEDHPGVIAAQEEDPFTKSKMLEEGWAMVLKMYEITAEEQEFLTKDRWSELLGAILLNGQERTPNSPYVEYTEYLRSVEGDAAVKSLKKRLGGSSVVNKCATSSRGQGIYTIGACFNHTCEPNLQVLYTSSNDETMCAIAIKDIVKGDEMTISYINEDMPRFERHQQLFEHYMFDCNCRKCEVDLVAEEKILAAAAKEAAADERDAKAQIRASQKEDDEIPAVVPAVLEKEKVAEKKIHQDPTASPLADKEEKVREEEEEEAKTSADKE